MKLSHLFSIGPSRQAPLNHESSCQWPSFQWATGPFFLSGFIDYSLSIPLCFIGLGLWLRYVARPRLDRWVVAILVATAVFFTYVVAFATMGLVVVIYVLLARQDMRSIVRSLLLSCRASPSTRLESNVRQKSGHHLP